MDSYNLHFERMSNVDLHTLSLPVNRLSPAKSNSSIIDQLAHHQHGKGDSAYSSFSGGSTAPDYPSAFLSDDLQSSSFSPYADLKYVKSIYHPAQSDAKTMDQLYRSVEAFSVHYCNNSSTTANQHNSNNRCHNNNASNNPEVFSGAPNQTSYPPEFPPPVPARLDSYIATKNLENNKVPQHGPEDKQHQLQSQQQPRPYHRIHTQQQGSKQAPSPDKSNSETADSGFHNDPVFSVWKDPQEQQPQIQQPPGLLPRPQSNNETRVTQTSSCLIMDNKAEHIKPRRLSTSSGYNWDHGRSVSSGTKLDSQRQRSHSEYDLLGSDSSRAASPWNAGQSFINSSIQHKGQFYFVTGLCKLPDSDVRTNAASVCGSDAGSECSSSTVVEKHWIREKERSHSTMDDLFRPLHENGRTFGGTIQDKNESSMSHSNYKDSSSKSLDQENHKPSLVSTRSSRSFDALEEMDVIQSREISRHIANNPIFYCGPDKNSFSHSAPETKEVSTLLTNEQPPCPQREEKAKKGKRQPLGEVASERINKETTPLLYHLTEGNKAALQPRKDADVNIKGNDSALNKPDQGSTLVNDSERAPRVDLKKNHGGDIISGAYNTLDESFKKYYKEKLKDAQSKVLRETSFKRRDLQLSWPHRIRQKPEFRPAVIHSFTSSLDSQTSTETLTSSVTSEDTDRCSIMEEVEETQTEMTAETEKENGRPENVAQPQVARVGGRRRLTPEQKKMCYSEPEKLNQLGGNPSHSACRSFGNESENVFAAECEREGSEQPGERGLVATRRKLFEMRGRANSASSTSKTNLKHLQHKALVEYMERKTGQKGAEPQQPAPQVPPPPRQRHSMGEKPFDWGPTVSGNNESKHTKKKLHRPLSAGRILDSSTSSIRYAQFVSTHSVSGQYSDQSNQPRWRDSHGPHQGKSASADSLLEPPGPSDICRNRSTSTPHVLETHTSERQPTPVNAAEPCSPQNNSLVMPDPESYQPLRVVAQRGKSMEELGTLKLAQPSGLSKSSEQLDRLWRRSPGSGGPDVDRKSFSFITEVREERKWLEKEKNKRIHMETAVKESENVQGPVPSQTGHTTKVLWKQKSAEPGEDVSVATRKSSRPTSPSSCSSTQARVHSGSHDPVTEEFRSCRPPGETSSNPPSPRGLDTSEKEIKSTSTSPVQTKPPCESRPSFGRVRTSSVIGSEMEQSVDEPAGDCQPAESSEEVSLSCGVTTDPALWILTQEGDVKKEARYAPPTDDISEDRLTCSAPQGRTSETSLSTCMSASAPDLDKPQEEEEEEKSQETEKVKLDGNRSEERGAPEGVSENLKASCEKLQWEELVEAVVKVDQSLARVFYPLTNRKTALMLMEQLLSEDTLLMEEHYKKKQEQGGAAESADTVKGSESSLCLPAADGNKSQYADLESQSDISGKKHLLVTRIEERLRTLEKMRQPLQNEIQENATRGQALELLVRERCQPLELERYSLFIGDLERVVSLLLCLSARLARVQNALSTVDQHTDVEEKESLDSRYRLLCKQREDAKDLKDNLDRRENLVSTFLSRQLSPEQLQDYRRFVQTKASLLIRQKDLEEKLRLGEEQLEALINSHGL